MAEQMRPASPQQAPDPSHSYERAHPGRESETGRLDADKSAPSDSPDQHREPKPRDVARHVSAEDVVNQRGGPAPVQPDHSMKDEEPDGWDMAPADIHDPQHKRHPRKEGKGGTP